MADMAPVPEITLKSIDADRLEDVEDNPEAVQFCITLSDKPSTVWIQEFEQAYRQTPYQIKPPQRVVEDMLEIVFLPRYAGELPGFFRFLTLMTRHANEETRRTEEIHAAGSLDRHKQEFRAALRRIDLSNGA